MPYTIVKAPKKKGYYVIDTSGRRYEKNPISLSKAKKQLIALHIHTGHGLDDIVMPKQAFIKEHKNLLKVLASKNPKKLKAEYNEQNKELKKVLRKKGGVLEQGQEQEIYHLVFNTYLELWEQDESVDRRDIVDNNYDNLMALLRNRYPDAEEDELVDIVNEADDEFLAEYNETQHNVSEYSEESEHSEDSEESEESAVKTPPAKRSRIGQGKLKKGGAGWSKLLYNKVQEYKRQKTTPEQDIAIALIYNGAKKALKEEGKSLSLLDKLKGKKRNTEIDDNKKFIVNNALDQMNSVFQNSFDIVNPLGRITTSSSSESTGMPAKHTSIKYEFSAAGKKKRGGMFNPLNVIRDKKQAYDKIVDELTQVNEQPAASIHSRKSLKSILDSVKQKLRGNEHGVNYIIDLQMKLESEEGYDDYKQRNKLFDEYVRQKVGGADEGSDEELAKIFGKVDIKDKEEEDKRGFQPIREKFKARPKPVNEQLFEAPPKKRALKYSGKKRLASEVGFEKGYGKYGGVKVGNRYKRNEVNLEDEDITELLRSGTHDEKMKKLRLLLKSREHLEKLLTKPREYFVDLVKERHKIHDDQELLEPKEWILHTKNFIAHNNLLLKESKLIILIFKLQQNLNMIPLNVMLREINKFERKIISINEENTPLLDELREVEEEVRQAGGMIRGHFKMNQILPPPQLPPANQPNQQKRPPPPSKRNIEADKLIGNENCAVCDLALDAPFKEAQNVHTGRCGHRSHINPCYNDLPGIAENPMNRAIGTKVCPKCDPEFIGYGKHIKGGMSIPDFNKWLDLTEDPKYYLYSTSDMNPLAHTHEAPDEDQIEIWNFLMDHTTDMDKLRLDKMELLPKLHFLFFSVWSLGELYNEFKNHIRDLKPFDSSKDNIDDYYSEIFNSLIENITEVLDPQKGYSIEDSMDIPDVVLEDRKNRLPKPKEFKAKGKGRKVGGVLGIVGNAQDFMIDDYNKARMANPELPPVEEIDHFLNRDDLLWIRRTLDSYKTWDNYLSKAKNVLNLEMPDNLQEFLKKRNAFTKNIPKMKYYLEHINRILPAGNKEKSLLDLAIEAEAKGEFKASGKLTESDKHILIGDELQGGIAVQLKRRANKTYYIVDAKTGQVLEDHIETKEEAEEALTDWYKMDYKAPTKAEKEQNLEEKLNEYYKEQAKFTHSPTSAFSKKKGLGKHSPNKIKFIKKYLKGQGIPVTKKNVAEICNIADVEGIVFNE